MKKPRMPRKKGMYCSCCGSPVPDNPTEPEWLPHSNLNPNGNYWAWSHHCRNDEMPNYKDGFLAIERKSLSDRAKIRGGL